MTVRYVCIKPSGYTLDGSESARYSAEYTSMSAAEAAENGSFSDNLYIEIIHGDATNNWDGTDDTTGVIWDGWDCTAGAKVIVRTLTAAQSANSTASRPDFSAGTRDLTEYRLYKNNNTAILVDNDHDVTEFLAIEFLGLQAEIHTSTGSTFVVQTGAFHTSVTVEKCWFKNSTSDWDVISSETTNLVSFINCVFEGVSTAINGVSALSNGDVSVVNCTVFNYTGIGIRESAGGTDKLVNNIVADNGDDFSGSFTGTLNASDDGDGPGTDITPSGADWDNEVTSAWTDLRPLDSGNIYHAGEVQNNDSDIPSDDIAGNPRPTGASAPTIGAFEFVASGGATVTGTAITGGVTESEIVTGGETIIITLTGDTWVATVGDDNAITDALILGITSAQSETNGWNNVVRANMVFGDVARTSDTIVTITLAAEATYSITANETITITIPATALTAAVETVATPTFVVTNEGAFIAAWANSSNVLLQPGVAA